MVELDQVEKVTTPRSSRFAVQSGLIAWIVPGDVEETPPACIPAEVMDISRVGVRLRAKCPIADMKTCRVTIVVEDLSTYLHLKASVRWNREEENGSDVLGCCLVPAIPAGIFDYILQVNHVDRRECERQPLNFRTSGVWRLGSKPSLFAVKDFSRDGFCVQTAALPPEEEHLHLYVEDAETTRAVVIGQPRWTLKADGGYVVGCSFLNPSDVERFKVLADAAQNGTDNPSSH